MDKIIQEIKTTLEEMKKGLLTMKELEKRVGSIEEKLAERRVPLLEEKEERIGFLKWFQAALKSDEEVLKEFYGKDAMGESVDADGGYLVPPEFYPTVIRLVEEFGIIRSGATVVPMKRDELNIPTLASGITIHWVDENTEETGQKPQFGNLKLVAKKGIAIVPISNELLEDSGIDIANLLVSLFAEAIAEEEDRLGFRGNTGGGDPFDGIMYDSNVTVVSLPSGKTSFSDVTADDLSTLCSSIKATAAKGAKFYLHRTILDVIRKLKDNNGNYIYAPPGGDQPATIWGYPFELSEVMPAIGDSGAGKPFIVFGNIKHFYLGDRKKMSIAKSVHAGFTRDQTLVRVTHRIGMGVGVPSAFAVLQTATS